MSDSDATSNTLKCGVLQLQKTIEESMHKHWNEFRKDSQEHFDSFRADYIEPSVQFIEHEKKKADSKYETLLQKYRACGTP